MMTTVVAEIRYDEDGGKVNWAEMTAYKCGAGDVGQQKQRKWSDGKSDRRMIEIGRREGGGVGEIK